MKTRAQTPRQNQWDLSPLFTDLPQWEEAFNKISNQGEQPRWPEIAKLAGTLAEGPHRVKEALTMIMKISREIEKLYTYAHLNHDVEITDDASKQALSKITAVIFAFQQEISWFDPELLALSQEKLQALLDAPELKEYRFHLDKTLRLKHHTLSSNEEKLLAMAGQPLQAAYKAFSALSDGDFTFGAVKDSRGKRREITHAQYSVLMRDEDRHLREQAFKKYHKKYSAYENTICQLLIGKVEANIFAARSRGYSSALEAALFPNQIDPSVYHALIQAVNQRLPSLHRYMKVRKEMLGVEQLHMYDMYVPLVIDGDTSLSYEEAEEAVIASVAPLGDSYQQALSDGLLKARWVDKYENKNKRSGAYSSGCYDSYPYILMNYKGILRDVYTLAHEAGHSMHSLLSRKSQPYHYADYPIFVAEVASTFNEELLLHHLLKKLDRPEQRRFLLNQRIEDIRATLFRQTMFAEFELFLHTMIEKNQPLTPKVINDEYFKLNTKYFGAEVFIDKEITIEWARIPHFYSAFYVYQYATGISAAIALVKKVLKEGRPAVENYLQFLRSGCSEFPIDLLRKAGVDMRTPEPVLMAIDSFDALVEQLHSCESVQV